MRKLRPTRLFLIAALALGLDAAAGTNTPPPTVFGPEFTAEERALLTQGEVIYRQLCFACHGLDGRGMPLTTGAPGATMAPPLQHAAIATGYRDGAINVVLKGITGPVDGKTYTAVMAPEQFNSDLWVAAAVSYVRASLGNGACLVGTNDVAAVRVAFTNRETPWTMPELLASLPPALTNRARWKLTASHNRAAAPLAVATNLASHYDSRVPQAPGMWFQIQLPRPTTIAGLELNANVAPADFLRAYQVQLSLNGRGWEPAVAVGRGTGPQTEIAFPPSQAKYIRITLTAADPAHHWSLRDLQVLAPAPPPPKPAAAPKPEPSKFD